MNSKVYHRLHKSPPLVRILKTTVKKSKQEIHIKNNSNENYKENNEL